MDGSYTALLNEIRNQDFAGTYGRWEESLFYRQIAIDAIEKTIAAANSSGMIEHPGLKGRLREIVVEELVKPFLNPHIRAATGTIVDPYGNQSRQVDVILYDEQVTPPILFSEREGVIPCHSVVATIEVKSSLTREELKSAVENARSVKLLSYDYGNIPFSGEVGFRRLFDAELLKLLPEGEAKESLNHALTIISSPACYVLAFTSDLALRGGSEDEATRLREVVDESNKTGQPIKIPISGLCVADRAFHYCDSIEPTTNIPVFAIKAADPGQKQRSRDQYDGYWASHNVVLEFISNLVNTCSTFASQRWRIPLDVYFKPRPGSEDD